ncbi:MAG: hypothetical protein PHR44_07020 [Candidatus Omnitrophica bacterium]|nr:hypothetical protein [Candidatus Omnitrophota bacterium]
MKALLSAVFLGVWSFFSPATLFIVILAILMLRLFSRFSGDTADRRFIIKVCILALSLRFILSFFHYYAVWGTQKGADFIGDARAYSASGQYIAEVITQKPALNIDNNEVDWVNNMRDAYQGLLPGIGYRTDIFVRYIGFIYSVFGYNPVIIKLINSLLSVLTGILLFILVRRSFSLRAAKIALILTLFWPSVLLWSTTGLKESLLIFLVVLNIFIYLMYLKENMNTLWFMALLLILAYSNYIILLLFSSLFCLSRFAGRWKAKFTFNKGIIAFLAYIAVMKLSFTFLELSRPHLLSLLLISFLLERILLFNKRVLSCMTILICAGILYFHPYESNIKERYDHFTRMLINRQENQLDAAYTAYKIYPEKYYNSKLSISYPDLAFSYFKGLSYVLFSPFPFSVLRNTSGLLGLMQATLFYILFPFIVIGIIIALRYRYGNVLLPLLFTFIILSAYALAEGNIGTVFRHRDTAAVFLLMFAAIGINHLLGGGRGNIIYEKNQ